MEIPLTATTQAELEEHVIALVQGQLDAILDRLDQQLTIAVPELETGRSDALLISVRLAAAAELRAGILAYRLGRLPTAPPTETGEAARLAARLQLPLSVLLRAYATAFTVYWQAIYEAILEVDAPQPARHTVIKDGTLFLHRFIDELSTLAASAYTDERDRALRKRSLRRLASIRDVLTGTASPRTVLDYPLAGSHVGIVATGADAEDAIAALSRPAGVQLLAVADEDDVWVWLAGSRDHLLAAMTGLTSVTRASLRIGIGRPEAGVHGFRITHRQARAAHRLAITLAQPVVRLQDVSLEALLGGDISAAAQFVDDELGDLIDHAGGNSVRLQTLRAYLGHGQNGASAAATLGVSQRTVSHRIHAIEQQLGHAVSDRAAELQTALRLQTLVDRVRRLEARHGGIDQALTTP